MDETELQKLCEAHLDACQEAMWDEDENESWDKESPSFGPFCGCTTCVVREVLAVAFDKGGVVFGGEGT